jgi:two-component system sensor histidine kinase/response regulator
MSEERIKFLLVDDTEENLVALEALLRRDGLELLLARSGAQALELLLLHDVALALLDVQMPDMDGFELAELMRGSERTRHVPIIFVTAGSRDPQRIFKGYETGAVDFLFKPIEPHIVKSKADVFFELYRQRRELANSLRLSEMFVGILGHDLRNPLSAVLTGAQLLQRQISDEAQLRAVRRVISASERMRDMVEQLLDLTRARLGGGLGFVRVRKPLEVAALVNRAADELRGAQPDHELRIETSGESTTLGDASRLMQLFSNLIANALHHGSPGAPVVVRVDGHDTEVVVAVHNAGAIPPALIPRIFDPFREGRGSTRSRGLGLGLFIAQQIVAAHGGSITVDSSEQEGTAFTVRLPRRLPTPHPELPGLERRHILIVDDDDDLRESLRDSFEQEGYDTTTVSNGQEALELLTGDSPAPDVVILDLALPVMDGGRVYQFMQSDPRLAPVPVIMYTSNPAQAPAGAVVVPKPLKFDRLLDAVAELWR